MNIGWTAHVNTRPAHIKVAMPGSLPLFCSNWRQINQSNANIKTDLSKKLGIHLKKCEQGTKLGQSKSHHREQMSADLTQGSSLVPLYSSIIKTTLSR